MPIAAARKQLAARTLAARHTARWATHNTRIWLGTRTKAKPPTRGGVAATIAVWLVLVLPGVGRWIGAHTAWLAYVVAVAIAAWVGLLLVGVILFLLLRLAAGRWPRNPA